MLKLSILLSLCTLTALHAMDTEQKIDKNSSETAIKEIATLEMSAFIKRIDELFPTGIPQELHAHTLESIFSCKNSTEADAKIKHVILNKSVNLYCKKDFQATLKLTNTLNGNVTTVCDKYSEPLFSLVFLQACLDGKLRDLALLEKNRFNLKDSSRPYEDSVALSQQFLRAQELPYAQKCIDFCGKFGAKDFPEQIQEIFTKHDAGNEIDVNKQKIESIAPLEMSLFTQNMTESFPKGIDDRLHAFTITKILDSCKSSPEADAKIKYLTQKRLVNIHCTVGALDSNQESVPLLFTLLAAASKHGNFRNLAILLKNGADVNHSYPSDSNAFPPALILLMADRLPRGPHLMQFILQSYQQNSYLDNFLKTYDEKKKEKSEIK